MFLEKMQSLKTHSLPWWEARLVHARSSSFELTTLVVLLLFGVFGCPLAEQQLSSWHRHSHQLLCWQTCRILQAVLMDLVCSQFSTAWKDTLTLCVYNKPWKLFFGLVIH